MFLKKKGVASTVLLLFASICLTASKCSKEECHPIIHIKNESKTAIIVGRVFKDVQGLCSIDGRLLQSEATYDMQPYRGCIEDRLGNGAFFEFLIIDSMLFAGNAFYQCDSIEVKNKILKHYKLTKGELQSSNFTISYK